MLMRYVLGFCFDLEKRNVILIRKNKPEWQKGKWNGVGGKIERAEFPSAAMYREFKEETGIDQQGIWHEFALLDGSPDFMVYTFWSALPQHILKEARTMQGELVSIFPVIELPEFCINNVAPLITIALMQPELEVGPVFQKAILQYAR